MKTGENILQLAEKNQQQAFRVIAQSNVIGCWQSINAKINLIGSLKTGLLMKHRDIDFHIYTPQLDITASFGAMAQLAENRQIIKTEYVNLMTEKDACLEWHAWYQDENKDIWQIDMIHMEYGTYWEGYFEKMAERILRIMTKQQKETILKLKFETPDNEKIAGIEYYMAVLRDGIDSYEQFIEWRRHNPSQGIVEWLP